jgi:hypothetical protein
VSVICSDRRREKLALSQTSLPLLTVKLPKNDAPAAEAANVRIVAGRAAIFSHYFPVRSPKSTS